MSTTPNKQITPVDQVKQSITQLTPEFQKVMPPGVTIEKFIRVVHSAIQENADLLNMDRSSLFAACMKAAQSGLMPDGAEAALLPYKGRVRFTPMVKGITKKIRATGIKSMTVLHVHENDKFRYWVDDSGQHLEHEPVVFGNKGKLLGVYMQVVDKDGNAEVETMDLDQLEAIKKASPSGNGGPWGGPFKSEMEKKSVIRRMSKRMDLDPVIREVIAADDELFIPGKEVTGTATTVTADTQAALPAASEAAPAMKTVKRSSKLANAVGAKPKADAYPTPPAPPAIPNMAPKPVDQQPGTVMKVPELAQEEELEVDRPAIIETMEEEPNDLDKALNRDGGPI